MREREGGGQINNVANKIHCLNVVIMTVHRMRRLPNIKKTLVKQLSSLTGHAGNHGNVLPKYHWGSFGKLRLSAYSPVFVLSSVSHCSGRNVTSATHSNNTHKCAVCLDLYEQILIPI